jgi:putative ATPase
LNLFDFQLEKNVSESAPLAERLRPATLDEFVGQVHAVGPSSMIRHAVQQDRIFSMILWGPPGCGKTTLARIIARQSRSHFIHFSAVLSGVKEIREVIKEAKDQRLLRGKKTILFVDEIHRFNKAQQDAFLHHVESGLITLIGATTENPSFEVIAPLLSRCRVITLNPLSKEELREVILHALKFLEKDFQIRITEDAIDCIAAIADGDARMAINNLEIVLSLFAAQNGPQHERIFDRADVEKAFQRKSIRYDKAGEEHFNLISAFHKSLRGSDPDAALYWMGRMILAGEDPLYIARRMVRFASEDVGCADPFALTLSVSSMEAFRFIGLPEGELVLAQCAVYLATAPKSNRIYTAYNDVKRVIQESGTLPVPLHIRNAPTALMKSLGYGKNYRYAHDFAEAITDQQHLPDEIAGRRFYDPTERGYEKTIKGRMDRWRNHKSRKETE